MSKIEEMIMELCPNGVEWKKLGEVCEIIVGGDIPNNTKKGFGFDGEHCYPIYSNGVGQNSLYGFTDSYRIAKEAVTISARGTIGWHCVRKPYFTPIVRLITLVPHDVIVVKYLDAVLDVVNIEGSKGGIPQLTVPNVKNIQIPLPPLPIQEEIVRILDKFVEQQEQLEQLIELRKKQYEYYREELLTPKDGEKITKLESIAEIGTGSSNTNEEIENGKYPFFVRSQDVRSKNEYEFEEEAVITSGDGVGVGKIFHYINGKYALHQRAYRIHITDVRFHTKFFFYYMKNTFFDYISKTEFKSSVQSIRRPMLNNYPVPCYSLDRQKEIIEIFDSFESSIKELSLALEECKARYAHYRDQLLNFKSA